MNDCDSEQGVGRGLQPVTFLLNTFNNHSGETPVASYAALPFFVTSQVSAVVGEMRDESIISTQTMQATRPAFSTIIRVRECLRHVTEFFVKLKI
jgi:hypothetical protein